MTARFTPTLAALCLATLLWQPARAATISNSGPRVGALVLVGGVAQKAREQEISPLLSAFGWQFESEFLGGMGSVKGNSSLVLLVAGADQGRVSPSATWLVGMRTANGTEFGVGPNISAAGSGFTLALGRTRQFGELNVPFNLTGTLSHNGIRFGLMTGFNMRDTPRPGPTRPVTPHQP